MTNLLVEHDEQGRATHEVSIYGTETWYTYDEVNSITQKEKNGLITYKEFDGSGNLTRLKVFPMDVSYKFDDKFNCIETVDNLKVTPDNETIFNSDRRAIVIYRNLIEIIQEDKIIPEMDELKQYMHDEVGLKSEEFDKIFEEK